MPDQTSPQDIVDAVTFEALAKFAPGGRSMCPVDGCDWYVDVPDAHTVVEDHGDLTIRIDGVGVAEVEAVIRGHLEGHDVVDFVRTIAGLRGTEVTEYAQRWLGGEMLVRNPAPHRERIYPLDQWIRDYQAQGGAVCKRRIIVVDDWAEVPRG